ncbi:class I SAM-dependent methyltransferase [Erythrobacter sp. SDW2]|uniref:class I SAM-dependent methyltransferase n=1 Tax=Erythrobacter sp. SDW2 TaxID=2907154 RepID=UPI001F1FAEC8|nr:class I SAM-dependent methyltransferase [Erythrobacter sp. SDW2]UIP06433.1 class I SAM-dependent methyltransferase [Erythrobacter sp. SDW2]
MSERAEDYGWTAHDPGSSSYIAPEILRQLRALGAKRVLDAGCGNGSITGLLAREGFAVSGIDGDAGGIAIAQAMYPQVPFAVADFGNDGSALTGTPFDAVVSTEVVEHLYAPHELARFAWEALKPGGHFIVTTPYHGYLKNLALAALDKWDHHHTALWHGGHIKFWSRATLGQLLGAQGFEPVSFGGVGRLPYVWKSMVMTVRKPG